MMTLKIHSRFISVTTIMILSGFCYLSLYSSLLPRIELYVFVSLLSSALYCILAWIISSDEADFSSTFLLWVVFGGLLCRIILLWIPPTGSDDIFRYIWDGKVQSAGIDPYRYEPRNPALQALHSDLLPSKINFPGMKSIYPPFTEWFFVFVYTVTGESILGFKIAMLLVEVVTILLLTRLLKEMKKPKKYLLLYVVCPLPILQFAVDGHCDVLVFPFLLVLIFCWTKGKLFLSYCSAGIAVIAKVFPIVFLPALVFPGRKKYSIFAVVIPLFVVVLAYLPYILMGSFPFETIKIFSLNWAANGLLFECLYTILKNNQHAHIAMALLTVVWIFFVLWRKLPLVETMYEILIGFFIFSSTVHPWYVTSVAVLLPLVPRKSGIVFAALVSLSTIQLIPYVLYGVWQQSIWLMMLEYLPVYFLLYQECSQRSQRGSALNAL